MTQKKVLMIHEMREWMFNLPLENFELTFDDGLFSQYYYLDRLKQIPTKKTFFISTDIVCPEDETQLADFPTCVEAHDKYFQNNERRHYMKWSQIKEIYNTENCFIGGHSHFHKRVASSPLSILFQHLSSDTELMIKEFSQRDIKITKFCYPYNQTYLLYEEILKKNGITDFFGNERTAIESLEEQCRL